MQAMQRTKDDQQWQPMSIEELKTAILECYQLHWKATLSALDQARA